MMSTLNDRMRQAILASDMNRHTIAKVSGVSASMLCRFMAHERGLSADTLEKLANALGLVIRIEPKRQRKAR